MSDKELEKYVEERVDKLIDLKRGDDHGDLYYLPGGHYSHPVDSALSLQEIETRIRHYALGLSGVSPDDLADDVQYLSAAKDAIALLFYRPGNFLQSDRLQPAVQQLLEFAFLSAILQKAKDQQNSLIDVLDTCYMYFYSFTLQDALLFAAELNSEFLNSRTNKMLRFFYTCNGMIVFERNPTDNPILQGKFSFIVNNQNRILNLLLASMAKNLIWSRQIAKRDACEKNRLSPEVEKRILKKQDSIFDKLKRFLFFRRGSKKPKNRPLKAGSSNGTGITLVSSGPLRVLLTDEERRNIKQTPEMKTLLSDFFRKMEDNQSRQLMLHLIRAEQLALQVIDLILPAICDESRHGDIIKTFDLQGTSHLARLRNLRGASLLACLHTFSELGLPRALGYLLCNAQNYKTLVGGGEQEIDVRYRLLALRRWVAGEPNPFEDLRYSFDKKIIDEARSVLTNEAKALLDKYSFGSNDLTSIPVAPWMQLWEKAVEVEALYTAAVLALHAQYAETDIYLFLKRLRYVIAFEDGYALVVSDDGLQAKAYFLPVVKDAAASCATKTLYEQGISQTLTRFVECLYRCDSEPDYIPEFKAFEEDFMSNFYHR